MGTSLQFGMASQIEPFPQVATVGHHLRSLAMGPAAGGETFEAQWYAAYTSANHEKRVAEQVERRSLECFLPLYESVRRWKDRRVRLEMPLFPGYVFVRLALRERLRVLEIAGVARLVGFDGRPTPVPGEDIETIRACLAGRHALQPYGYVQSGQRVRVLRGPLAGMTGIVMREKKRALFVISLELLMRSVAVEVEESAIDLCI